MAKKYDEAGNRTVDDVVAVGEILWKKVLTPEWVDWYASRPEEYDIQAERHWREEEPSQQHAIICFEVLSPGVMNEDWGHSKCRVRSARVISPGTYHSHYNDSFVYSEGAVITIPEKEWVEYEEYEACGAGIHGFRTKEEAESYRFT